MLLPGTAEAQRVTITILLVCALLVLCAGLSYSVDPVKPQASLQSDIVHADQEGNVAAKSPESVSEESFSVLKRLAAEEVAADGRFLGKTRFAIDRQNRTFFYDLDPIPLNLVLSRNDAYGFPLEAIIRVESLRRDFRAEISDEPFWSDSLESVERAVHACVDAVETVQQLRKTDSRVQECSPVNQEFNKLKALLLAFASSHGLRFFEPIRMKDPVPGYRVHIVVDPPKAKIRVITRLEFKKYQYTKTPKSEYQWNDLLADEDDLIGWYHYLAEWPSEFHGPEEGDFEVQGPATITFRPPAK